MSGRLFAIVGPSGAGKDTLIQGALAVRPGLSVVRRVITRPTSAGGEDFEGVTAAAFAARSKAGEFALTWQAHGLSYGIPKSALLPLAQDVGEPPTETQGTIRVLKSWCVVRMPPSTMPTVTPVPSWPVAVSHAS